MHCICYKTCLHAHNDVIYVMNMHYTHMISDTADSNLHLGYNINNYYTTLLRYNIQGGHKVRNYFVENGIRYTVI